MSFLGKSCLTSLKNIFDFLISKPLRFPYGSKFLVKTWAITIVMSQSKPFLDYWKDQFYLVPAFSQLIQLCAVCVLCNISLMLLLWIVLQNAYLEQKKKVISVYSTIYCICMLCYACHTRLIYNKLRKVCFWQCFKFLLFAFCHRSLAESSFIIIHFALTLEKILVLYFWKLDRTTNK